MDFVDREERDKLIEIINRFINREITSFQYDDELFEELSYISEDSLTDQTIIKTRDILWYYYDDIVDHKAEFSKEAWDFHQRLILILKSDAHIREESKSHFTHFHPQAAIELSLFILSYFIFGISMHLAVAYILIFIQSILLNRVKRKEIPVYSEQERAVMPFSSVSEMAKVYKSVNDHQKIGYQAELQTASTLKTNPIIRFTSGIQTFLSGLISTTLLFICWLVFAPLIVLFQLAPCRITKTCVELPKAAA